MNRSSWVVLGLLALGFLPAGCSTVPEGKDPAKAALLAEPPKEYLDRIDLAFRKRVAFMDDRPIEAYLTRLATRLFPPGKDPVRISLVSTVSAGYVPSVWVAPGGRIFFYGGVLRALRFENEIAAAIAFAWERSEGTEFRERLIAEAQRAAPDPTRIWVFSELENEAAIEGAVDRTYKAGYDPRGLVSYFDRVPSEKAKGQFDSETEVLKDKTRRTIAFYAPLLNPIVRTEDFYKMRKRLERL